MFLEAILMKKRKIKAEMIVFGIIILFVVLSSYLVTIPQKSVNSSLPYLGKAPELVGTQEWINSEPLTIENLRGKVILVDFWTYSCINCIRTLPYLKSWHEKYGNNGLVIIGVHTPEFEFEKDYGNVKNAVEKYKIKYAVVQDNNYATWNAYNNHYWPRKYVVDKDGNIRYDHIGEGAYEETEKVIIDLLKEIKPDVSNVTINISSDVNFSEIGTPELYFGYKFSRTSLGNEEGFSPGDVVDYKHAEINRPNTIYLSGSWKNEADKMIAVGNSSIFLLYKAKNVNIVAGGDSSIDVFLDDNYLQKNSYGTDAKAENEKSIVRIDSHRLYNIVSTPDYEIHVLQINASNGFEIYTFTFG